jgi:hypothetical protein
MLKRLTAAALLVLGSPAGAWDYDASRYGRAELQTSYSDGAAVCYEARFSGFILQGERDVPRLRLRTLAACAPLIRLAFRTTGNLADDDAVALWERWHGLAAFDSLHIPYTPAPGDWSKQSLKALMAENSTTR